MTRGNLRPLRAHHLIAATLALMLLFSQAANAELIDQIDLSTNDIDQLIDIRFSTTVQYQRHQPLKSASLLKIEFQITGQLERSDGRLLSELRRHPGNSKIPAFEVGYDSRTGFMSVKFGRVTNYQVGAGVDPRSIRIVIPGPKGIAKKPANSPPPITTSSPKEPSPKPAVDSPASISTITTTVNSEELETQAKTSLQEAKKALGEMRTVLAIDLLNKVLNLPPTAAAQEAQELIGQAREANGEIAKARTEYELYLKLYPATPGTDRVKKRLASLSKAIGTLPATKVTAPAKPEYSYFGSVSSYYYHGSTKYDATLAPPQPGLAFDQISLTGTDQSALVTNIDLNARYRGGAWDSKLVVRDTSSQSFLTTQKSYNRLNNAYVETLNKGLDFFARVGRQSSPGYGVLGRFDGAWMRYGFNANAKFDLVAGEPVEFYSAPKKKFIGGAFDLGPFAERWSGNVFAIEQRVDGFGDRRAIGSEVRYLDPQKNGFALFDYDLNQKALNIALLQGNWQVRESTGLNFLFDRRRSPSLQLTNSLNALPLATIRENFDSGISVEELRNVSRTITPLSTLFSIGATHQFSPKWQLSGDIKYSEVSETNAIGSLMAQPSTGKVFVYGLQAIRTGIFTINDIIVASTSIIRGKTYNGESYQLSHVLLLAEKWRVESTFRYYRQRDNMQSMLTRLTPSARMSYRVLERLSIESEIGAERSTTNAAQQSEKNLRKYYNFGVRYDFY